MNKHLLILTATLLTLTYASAQSSNKYIDLSTGEIFTGVAKTTPIKTVEEDEEGITVSYSFDYAELIPDNDYPGTYYILIDGLTVSGMPTEPAYIGTNDIFNIIGYGNPTIAVTSSSYIDVNVDLAPAPTYYFDESAEKLTLPISTYSGYMPAQTIKASAPYKVRDGEYVEVALFPVQYDMNSHNTKICNSITYRITPNNSNRPLRAAAKDTVLDLNENLETVVSNPSRIKLVPSTGSEDNIGMLIVTSPQLESSLTDFIKHKNKLGIRTYVKTFANATDADTTKIQRYIQSEVNNNRTIKYLLIAGDNTHIPAFQSAIYKREKNPDDNKYHEVAYPYVTDLYYVGNKDSYLASTSHGRIPVATNEELSVVLDKIIHYETAPPTDESFYKTMVFSSHFETSGVTDKERQKELSQYRLLEYADKIAQNLEAMYEKKIERNYALAHKTYTVNDVEYKSPRPLLFADGDTVPSYMQNDSFWVIRPTKDFINRGINIYFYNGHGNITNTGADWFTTRTVQQLTNGYRLPIVIFNSCLIGAYNQTRNLPTNGDTIPNVENLTRAFLKFPNGGCVGVIAATAESYAPQNNQQSAAIFDGLYPGSGILKSRTSLGQEYFLSTFNEHEVIPRMGDLSDYALKHMRNVYPTALPAEKNCETYHYFGDPTMRARTEVPAKIQSPSICVTTDGNGEYLLSVFAASGTDFAVCKEGEQPHRFVGCITNFKIDNPNTNKYTVCIDGFNMIPYFANLSVSSTTSRTLSAKYNISTSSIDITYMVGGSYTTAYVVVYDAYGNLMGTTKPIYPTGRLLTDRISVRFNSTGPYVVSVIADGNCIESTKVSK